MKLFFTLILLSTSSCGHISQPSSRQMTLVEFPLKKYSKTLEGGFSGLDYGGKTESGEMIFWTHTDRGANAEQYKDPKTGEVKRPFLDKDFRPKIVQFKVNLKAEDEVITYLKEIYLKRPDGTPMTGLPNLAQSSGRTGDETPVTACGKPIKRDLMGIDPEAMCVMKDSIWMAEEYGPSLLKFDLKGKLITRYLPKGYYSPSQKKSLIKKYGENSVREVLPKFLLKRKLNRGFEGIACTPNIIYATLQSPLPDEEKNIRIIEFNLKEEKVNRTLNYQLDSLKADKIGDMELYKGELLLIEQNSKVGKEAFKKVYAASLSEVDKNSNLKKRLLLDLSQSGFNFAKKLEGLAMTPDGYLAVVNDNDFGLTGHIDPKTSKPEVDSNNKSVFGIIKLD